MKSKRKIAEAVAGQHTVLLLTLHYKRTCLEKQGRDLPVGRPRVSLHWRGGWVGEGQQGKEAEQATAKIEFLYPRI